MKEIGDLLDEINYEARSGMIDCGLKHWLYYTSSIVKDREYTFNDVRKEYEGVLVPCLRIANKDALVDKISEYLDIAESFYDELDYDRVSDIHKYTIATLFSNMTIDDFNNSDMFIKRRIAFLQDNALRHFNVPRDIGYSNIFDANIEVELRKEPIFMETPYGMYISMIKYTEEGRKLSYPLPVVRFGIDKTDAYFYAIQKDQSEEMPNDKDFLNFGKKIRRKMYGIGTGLTDEERGIKTIDNIHEVSPWAVIALTIVLGLLKKFGVGKAYAYPLLLNRYNANVIYSHEELERLKDVDDEIYREIKEHLLYLKNNINVIQENITDKFIRTFRRIGYHFPGINIDDVSLVENFVLKMHVNDGDRCNNPLLDEMFKLGTCYNYGEVKRLN